MPALQPARGTQDLLPEMARRHRRVGDTARALAELYGFAEIATPVFEFTEVFARPIGEHTDIVAKEMYTFSHRPRRRGGDAPAGKYRRGRARGAVERADPKHAAQILLQRPDVPLRAAAEGSLPPVSPDRRRAVGGGAAAGRCRSHRARPADSWRARYRRQSRPRTQHARRSGEPGGIPRRARRLFLGAPLGIVRGQPPAARTQPAPHPRFKRSRRPAPRRRGGRISPRI